MACYKRKKRGYRYSEYKNAKKAGGQKVKLGGGGKISINDIKGKSVNDVRKIV